jgi:serine/threonine-protein kinase HipA
MLFNVLIGNTDDHLRNHAVINFGSGYRLSPAFDVMPWPVTGGERLQALGVGREGRLATIENAITDCALFGLKSDEAEAEAQRLQELVAREWEAAFDAAGVPARELDVIGRLLQPDALAAH